MVAVAARVTGPAFAAAPDPPAPAAAPTPAGADDWNALLHALQVLEQTDPNAPEVQVLKELLRQEQFIQLRTVRLAGHHDLSLVHQQIVIEDFDAAVHLSCADTVDVGAGITVNSTTVDSPTQITANSSISSVLGSR